MKFIINLFNVVLFQTVSLSPSSDRLTSSEEIHHGSGGGEISLTVAQACEHGEHHILSEHSV